MLYTMYTSFKTKKERNYENVCVCYSFKMREYLIFVSKFYYIYMRCVNTMSKFERMIDGTYQKISKLLKHS